MKYYFAIMLRTALRSKLAPILLILAACGRPFAQDSSAVPFSGLFRGMPGNAWHSLSYDYGLNYAAAAVAAYGLVETGLDWRWYRLSVRHVWISRLGFVSVGAGSLVPMTLPAGLFVYGRVRDETGPQVAGEALGQAALLGLGISSTIKVFTGRLPPDDHKNPDDYSDGFRFGFWRGGAFNGWPSSHTATAFAMSGAFAALYPDHPGWDAAAYAYAALIGAGVSTNIHWLSDAVSGGLIGYAIGRTVGSDFAARRAASAQSGGRWSLRLIPDGAEWAYTF